MTVTNEALQGQITNLDKKVDERHVQNTDALEAIGKKMDTLIELHVSQQLQAQVIGQMSEKLKENDKAHKEFYERLSKAESTNEKHGLAWKILGALVLTAITGTGWILMQMKDFYQYQDKVDTLEFIVQGRTTPVLPPAQTSSGSK
jgi:hypothetical protein